MQQTMTTSRQHPTQDSAALFAAIKTCVQEVDSDGVGDLLPELKEHLPGLLQSSNDDDFETMVKATRLICFSDSPKPVPTAISILLDIAAALAPRGRAVDAMPFAERAHDLAEANRMLPELRRACSICGVLNTEGGTPARSLEYAIKAAEIAREIDDPIGIVAAWSNTTATLFCMGLYRESIAVALRTIRRFNNDTRCAAMLAGARGNMASAALALSRFALAADLARNTVAEMGVPSDALSILHRVIAESVWMNAAIELDQRAVVDERIAWLRSMSDAFTSPRLQLNLQLAEAAYEAYAGDPAIAAAKLSELLKHTRAMPNVYRDNLALLVKVCEKTGDHGGALIYLSELVEFLREKQVATVRASLAAIEARHSTQAPGKDDARAVIYAIQKSPPRVPTPLRGEAPELAYREAFERLAVSAEMREDASGRHAYRVGRLSGLLAEKLGCDAKFADAVDKGARLHDIGKLGIPDNFFLKSSELSPHEWAVMKSHTQIGAQIIRQCTHSAFRLAEQIALCHHEKWDGTGYPSGLKGEAIPEAARIATLADVYDALTHARAYKHAWTHDAAVKEIERMSGTHFEPRMVDAFVKLIRNLHAEHGEALDDFLAKAGEDSTFIQARDKMQSVIDLIPE